MIVPFGAGGNTDMMARLAAQHLSWKLGQSFGAENKPVAVQIPDQVLINGELARGLSGMAGEFGHMTVDPDGPRCNCGNLGCIEQHMTKVSGARDKVISV